MRTIRLERMLLIGSTGVNVGKTELGCALIRRFGSSAPIVAIKVTTIRAKDGQCPRGGAGCGVCSSIEQDFLITQEMDRTSGKDTARLLDAGADRVFWLRVMKTSLQQGLHALLEMAGPQATLICESNSLRRVVQPGLFLMVTRRGQPELKKSAREVADLADKMVTLNGNNFDLDIERINLLQGKWTLREQATAIIMAGGLSTRMGRDKSFLPLKDQPMIKRVLDRLAPHFEHILISANDADRYGFLGVKVVPDRVAGRGPLMGIASALAASPSDINFVIACDIPEFDMALVRQMLRQAGDFDAAIPRTGRSQYEPLFAVYKKSAIGAMEQALSSGKTRVMDGLTGCKVKYVDLPADERPRNINTMADYREFVEREKDAVL